MIKEFYRYSSIDFLSIDPLLYKFLGGEFFTKIHDFFMNDHPHPWPQSHSDSVFSFLPFLSNMCQVTMIMVTYSCIAPLMMPFCTLFFMFAYLMYKYQVPPDWYIYRVKEIESKGEKENQREIERGRERQRDRYRDRDWVREKEREIDRQRERERE